MKEIEFVYPFTIAHNKKGKDIFDRYNFKDASKVIARRHKKIQDRIRVVNLVGTDSIKNGVDSDKVYFKAFTRVGLCEIIFVVSVNSSVIKFDEHMAYYENRVRGILIVHLRQKKLEPKGKIEMENITEADALVLIS